MDLTLKLLVPAVHGAAVRETAPSTDGAPRQTAIEEATSTVASRLVRVPNNRP